jgi:heme-degrading monooxygenase HmoA
VIVTVFRSRLNPNVDTEELTQLDGRMAQLASSMPGFISYKNFASEDGEGVTIVEFESLETQAAWREHPEHKAARARGRAEFFAEYHIQVCTPVRDSIAGRKRPDSPSLWPSQPAVGASPTRGAR